MLGVDSSEPIGGGQRTGACRVLDIFLPSDFLCSNEAPFFSLGEDKAFQGRKAGKTKKAGKAGCCAVLLGSRFVS